MRHFVNQHVVFPWTALLQLCRIVVMLFCIASSRVQRRSPQQPPKRAAAVGHVHVYWAQGAWHREGGSLQHLYAVIAAVAHNDAALAVDQNAVGRREPAISTAYAADGSHVAAVTVA